jgi:CRISPR-associated protein (TIGR02584 family)
MKLKRQPTDRVSRNQNSEDYYPGSVRADAGTPSAPRPSAYKPRSEIVLLAVTGKSPAVLTETVWALAHEKPPVVPDRIVVITTASGREAVQRELFGRQSQTGEGQGRCVWDALLSALGRRGIAVKGKLRFGITPNDIRVFTCADKRGRSIEMDDIRTPADNQAAADFLLDKLRELTENEDVQLTCSLAGGRKTMGTLLHACLSLIGREDDRLTHVLVNEPFDDPRRQPRFYFPTPADFGVRIELADVPFVPLRRLFPRELGRMPGRFMNLVQQYRSAIERLAEPPRVELAEDEPVARIDGVSVRMPPTAFALFSFLVRRARMGEPAFPSYKDALSPFKAYANERVADPSNRLDSRRDTARALARWDESDTQDLRKQVNAIKSALQRSRIPSAVTQHLLPRKGYFAIRIRT